MIKRRKAASPNFYDFKHRKKKIRITRTATAIGHSKAGLKKEIIYRMAYYMDLNLTAFLDGIERVEQQIEAVHTSPLTATP